MRWLVEEWETKGTRYPRKVVAVRIQAVLWGLKLERLLRPDELESKTFWAVEEGFVQQDSGASA